MSVFTGVNQVTDRQMNFIHTLILQRFSSMAMVPLHLRPNERWTIKQASAVIDELKSIETVAQRQQRREREYRDSINHWLWGRDTNLGAANDVPEDAVARRWDCVLEPHFHIMPEAWGTHFSGQRLRIDRILAPKGWHWACGHQHSIGLEIKTGRAAKKAAGQAADYANTRWDVVSHGNNGHILVGIHVDDPDQTRALSPMGVFGFHVDMGREPRSTDLSIYWNGSRMWTGAFTRDGAAVIDLRQQAESNCANNKWCPTRKFGSR